ncbi:aldo/keto reductase [Actinokineospora soli]|uniref:Aldo/keto reductase n=1 Tax=Actinokineospora soli TaxID=1048753 RepID=A0ABW2TW68_9PSEU
MGGVPGEHPGGVARVDPVLGPAGPVQPAEPRHRTRTPAHGGVFRDDRHRVGALAAGKLSGGTRRGQTPTPREQPAVAAVRSVAADLGATPAQVALAWIRSKSRAVIPLVGVSSTDQLTDNLRALDLTLPADALTHLESAVPFDLGFPGAFIAECEPNPFVFGDSATKVDA